MRVLIRCGARRKFEFGDSERAAFHIGVVLDPVSETAQKWSALLEVRAGRPIAKS